MIGSSVVIPLILQCTHFYEDISGSAHAIVDKCEKDGKVKMVAELVLDNDIHIILPKGIGNSGLPQQHGLFKVNNTINFENDYSKLSDSSNGELCKRKYFIFLPF